ERQLFSRKARLRTGELRLSPRNATARGKVGDRPRFFVDRDRLEQGAQPLLSPFFAPDENKVFRLAHEKTIEARSRADVADRPESEPLTPASLARACGS